MTHKTMIDGVAYEISGGKTLIDGTAYSIKNGKTLVGGTAYEVGFAPAEHDVVVTGGYSGTMGNRGVITIDGTSYANKAFDVAVKSTSQVTLGGTAMIGNASVILNGETVASGNPAEYTVDLSDVTHMTVFEPKLNAMAATIYAYTYNFKAQEDVTVTVTGTGYNGLAAITYNGVTYTSAITFTAKTGDIIYCQSSGSANQMGISYGGKGSINGGQLYFVVNSDTTIALSHQTGSSVYGSVTIHDANG